MGMREPAGSRGGYSFDLPQPTSQEADHAGRWPAKAWQPGGQLDSEVSGEAWRPGLPAEPRGGGGWLGEGRRLEIVLTPAENSLQNFISSARRRWGRGQA